MFYLVCRVPLLHIAMRFQVRFKLPHGDEWISEVGALQLLQRLHGKTCTQHSFNPVKMLRT